MGILWFRSHSCNIPMVLYWLKVNKINSSTLLQKWTGKCQLEMYCFADTPHVSSSNHYKQPSKQQNHQMWESGTHCQNPTICQDAHMLYDICIRKLAKYGRTQPEPNMITFWMKVVRERTHKAVQNENEHFVGGDTRAPKLSCPRNTMTKIVMPQVGPCLVEGCFHVAKPVAP